VVRRQILILICLLRKAQPRTLALMGSGYGQSVGRRSRWLGGKRRYSQGNSEA
jgi:hypothetical protein